jgi:seryl-tRNA synthetase
MPLIALDILESKLKELLMVTNHLKSENELLKRQLAAKSPAEASAEIAYEMDKMKKTVAKYKSDRSVIYSKIAGALKQINNIIEKENNG